MCVCVCVGKSSIEFAGDGVQIGFFIDGTTGGGGVSESPRRAVESRASVIDSGP